MKFSFSSQTPTSIKADVLGVFLFEGKTSTEDESRAIGSALAKEVVAFKEQSRFTGKERTALLMHTHRKIPSFLCVFAGLGKKETEQNILAERVREAASQIAETSTTHHGEKIALIIPRELTKILGSRKIGSAIAEGIILGRYQFVKYKNQTEDEKKTAIKEVIIIGKNKELIAGVRRAEMICGGVTLARDLVNEPAEAMRPSDLVACAKSLSDECPEIALTVLGKKELKAQKFGGILAVSQGSAHEPYLIHLVYRPKEKKDGRKLAIVGKGITFDSGGLSIKPAQSMESMKTDMAGAATVLGLFSILPKLRVPREIHGIIATCENMVSASSIRPGDIITMRNGSTVEVLNTDAEGRIILGDAITYALQNKSDAIIDLATLTGACIVALGDAVAGLIGNNEELGNAIIASGRVAGEKIWQLPLEESYKEAMRSDVADLRNISILKGGGAIMGAIFLEHFVGKIPWAHLDIAGPAWVDKPMNLYIGKGATGFGVRTLAEYCANR